MRITVNANILFVALLRKGMTRDLWFNADFELYSPKYILEEFISYQPDLFKRFGKSKEDFEILYKRLLSQIIFIEDENLVPYLPIAGRLQKTQKIGCILRVH